MLAIIIDRLCHSRYSYQNIYHIVDCYRYNLPWFLVNLKRTDAIKTNLIHARTYRCNWSQQCVANYGRILETPFDVDYRLDLVCLFDKPSIAVMQN